MADNDEVGAVKGCPMPDHDLSGRRVLITQAHLVHYQGSEIVTLELAEYLASQGADVIVAVQAYGYPLREEFERREIAVYEILDPELERVLEQRAPDIAWIQHSIIPDALLRAPRGVRFYFHHMSAHLAPEFTLIPELERRLATAVLFESPSSLVSHRNTGAYDGMDDDRLQVFGNPAPERFGDADRDPEAAPRRLLVVSNHLQPELLDALRQLDGEFEVELVGSERELGATPKRIEADDIARAGAVISIGKTVQYALAVGTPVFVYDHFGGPGWLTPENFEGVAFENFSGRGSAGRMSADEIAAQLRDGFEGAGRSARQLHALAATRYVIGGRFRELLRWSEGREQPVDVVDPELITSQQAIQAAIGHYIREWIRKRGDAVHNADLAEAWEQREKAAVAHIRQIEQSSSYRLGLKLTRFAHELLRPYTAVSRRLRSAPRDSS